MEKIYINGFFLSQTTSGVQRFAYNILKNIDILLNNRQNANKQFICIIPKKLNITFVNIELKVVKSIGFIDNNHILWEQLILPFVVKKHLLLNLCNFAPLFKRNQLVVIHDAIPFRYPKTCSFIWRTLFKFMTYNFMHNVRYMASVSNFSADELCLLTNTSRKLLVLGNSGEHMAEVEPDYTILDKLGLKNKQYVFSVSSQANIEHKNFKILQQISNKIDLPVVAVGNSKEPEVIYTGRISDSELKALYSSAKIFIFPSLYEGFGIPILESFSCLTPCIVSDIIVFHEICKDAALYFNPNDNSDLINKIKLLQNDKSLYNNLINNSRSITNNYQWKKHAATLLNHLYQTP